MSVFWIRVPDPEMPAVLKFFLSHLFESYTLTKCARYVSIMPIERTWLEVSIPPLEREKNSAPSIFDIYCVTDSTEISPSLLD